MSIGTRSVHRSQWDDPFRYDVESQGPEEAGKANSEGIIPLDHNLSQSITRLHQTSQRHPETSLKWDFEEDGPNRVLSHLSENTSTLIKAVGKCCILIISNTAANPPTLTFKTPAIFMRKSEAKIQAAAAAVIGGALNYIVTGDPTTSISEVTKSQESNVIPEAAIKIENLIQECHRTKAPCNWYHLSEPKNQGMLLFCSLFSTTTMFL